MTMTESAFSIALSVVVYPYVLYPLWLAVMARLHPRPPRQDGVPPRSVSVIVAAYNEESAIETRLEELLDGIALAGVKGEIIVVSDGSTDETAHRARGVARDRVRVVELPENLGKAQALSTGCAEAVHEIVVFADVRQSWEPRTLGRLLDNFADPTVGAASGDLVISSAPGVLASVGAYWRYEKWIRQMETRLHSTVGVTGAICAVRRELFQAIPSGTILDDVYWPMRVVMQGHRVVHDPRARAYDRLPTHTVDEFTRKVRTLCGNFQLIARLPATLLPTRNPIWFQFISHKLMRLLVPWALLVMLWTLARLEAPLFQAVFLAQIGFYSIGLAGMAIKAASRFRPARDAAAFLLLNTAAWLAFWVWLLRRSEKTWRKVAYPELPLARQTVVARLPASIRK